MIYLGLGHACAMHGAHIGVGRENSCVELVLSCYLYVGSGFKLGPSDMHNKHFTY